MQKSMISQLLRIAGLALAIIAMPVTQAQPANRPAAALPPALQAAVLSGNADAIERVINTLAAGNPTQIANLANQVAGAGAVLLRTNPQASIAIAAAAAAAAVNAVKQPAVIAAAPTSVLTVVTTAARIMSNPAVIRTAPAQAGNLATTVASLATNPAIFQASPTTALAVLGTAYQTATNRTVQASAPAAATSVTQTLTQASTNPALATAFAGSATIISAILTGTNYPTIDNPTITTEQAIQEKVQPPTPPTYNDVPTRCGNS